MTTTSPETTQILLLASGDHNLDVLRSLLRNNTPNVQDPETGFTPLHAAIHSCAPTTSASTQTYPDVSIDSILNGSTSSSTRPSATLNGANGSTTTDTQIQERDMQEKIGKAEEVLRLLLQNGAIWNTLNYNNETPGCLAYRLGLTSLYEIMVDAGVRAELLFGKLEGYMELDGGDDDEEEEEDEEEKEREGEEENERDGKMVDPMAGEAGVDATAETTKESKSATDVNSEDYLKSALQLDDEKIVDEDLNGVMMSWETTIMQTTATLLLPTPNLRILNIGFGMGIVDTFFQSHSPASHHIVEAHPAILTHMHNTGWSDKPNVTIHKGRWQDVLPALIAEGQTFDAVYFDTFAEDYSQLKEFFEEMVVGLMDAGGRFGFFNGLGADRQVCYDVYAKVVEIHLLEAGLETEWTVMDIPKMGEKEWKGVRRKYWALEKYKLPICKFIE